MLNIISSYRKDKGNQVSCNSTYLTMSMTSIHHVHISIVMILVRMRVGLANISTQGNGGNNRYQLR